MRDTRSSGSVEGVMSNHAPYSDFRDVVRSACPVAMLTVRAYEPVGIYR
jgi:hypothetical protein